MKSEFLKWFKEQHGKRPCATDIFVLESEYIISKTTAENKLDLLIRTKEWDARKESALYAWQVENWPPKK